MPRGYDSDSDGYNEVTIVKTTSNDRRGSHRHEHRGRDGRYSPSNLSVNNTNYLGVPAGRPRASSVGATAQPVIKIYNEMDRSPSRERRRPSRSRRDSSSSEDDYYRWRHRRESEREHEFRKQMEKLRLVSDRQSDEYQKERILAQIARDEAKEKEKRERFIMEERMKEEEEKRKREKLVKEAEAEKELKKIRDKEARDKAVAEWKQEEFDKKEKERKKEAETEEEFEKRFRQTMRQSGVDEYQIDLMLERRKNKDKDHRRHSSVRSDELVIFENHGRPRFIKVSRKHLDPRTLDYHGYNWHWEDSRTKEHIIIEEWISQDRMDELFEHTRIHYTTLRITGPVIKETTLRPNDALGRDGSGMYVIKRSKSTGGGQGAAVAAQLC